jgi:trans-AT polyketide synthase/acyltransferase/oxidoreductase domain-containing protein
MTKRSVVPAPDAVVFPGQGTQRRGMGADFHEAFAIAARVFDEASEAAGEDLRRICFAEDERLHQTEFTQPCILTAQIAVFRVAVEEFGFAPRVFGGHSLGEYTALVAAGALPLADAVRLVRARGALMQQAVPAGQGAMAALMLNDIENSPALRLSIEAGAEIANYNSPTQAVISGSTDSLERAKTALAASLPDLTFIPLHVSAPFHCSLMQAAVAEFAARLESCAARMNPACASDVTSNYTGGFHACEALIANLVAQMSSPVRWLDNMRAIGARAGNVYEIGPRPALTKFFRLIGQSVIPVTKVAELRAAADGHPFAPRQFPERPAVPPLPPVTPSEPVATPAPSLPPMMLPGPVATPAPSLPPMMRPGPVATPAPSVPPMMLPGPVATPASLAPEDLGDLRFLLDHGASLAYVAGGMRMGISSPELVVCLGRAGVLAFLGLADLRPERAEQDILQVLAELRDGAPWGANLTADPHDPARTGRTVDLLLRHGVPCAEAAGFTAIDADLVRYRISGLRPGPDGRPLLARRLLAKVSGLDTARQFLAPPPPPLIRQLRERGVITEQESVLASRVAMADDICAESYSSGLTLLPAILALRDAQHGRGGPGRSDLPAVRVGLGGGLGTPQAVAAAFAMGADFVLIGSVNQCTPQAATSALVKDMLAAAGLDDFGTAPDSDLFELGGRVQVLRRGVLFPARGDKLYQTYLSHAELQAEDVSWLEGRYLRKSIPEVWAELASGYAGWDGAGQEKAAHDGGPRMARVCRWYLTDTLRRARVGEAGDRLNFQIRSSPAMGAFNLAVRGTPLADWRNRDAAKVAEFLMSGAAAILGDRRWRPARVEEYA